jgi:hypothetical protein
METIDMFTFAAAIALVGSAAGATAATEVAEPNPKAMSQSEIRAFNATLDKAHKHYIRCKKSAPTGSFVQREFSCRTNEQWAAADVRGNQEARDIGEEMQSKSWNTSN